MTTPKTKNPHTGQLEAETAQGSGNIAKHSARVERYAKAHARSRDMLKYLYAQVDNPGSTQLPRGDLKRLVVAMEGCGNYLVFRNYFTVNQVKLTKAQFCKKHHLCPLCAIRRGAKQVQAYSERHTAILSDNPQLRTSLLTMTVKNGSDLEERFEHLQRAITKLTRKRTRALTGSRDKTEFTKIHGAVGTYEVTNKGKGWHPHTHMIVLHDEDIDTEALAVEWHNITGDSWVIDLRPIQNPTDVGSDFVEVFKYAIKFSDLSLQDNYNAYVTLRGRRLVFSFGLFQGVQVPETMLDDELKDLPYIEMLYCYFGTEYVLTSSSHAKFDITEEEEA